MSQENVELVRRLQSDWNDGESTVDEPPVCRSRRSTRLGRAVVGREDSNLRPTVYESGRKPSKGPIRA
jgi:hypothetical protein